MAVDVGSSRHEDLRSVAATGSGMGVSRITRACTGASRASTAAIDSPRGSRPIAVSQNKWPILNRFPSAISPYEASGSAMSNAWPTSTPRNRRSTTPTIVKG
jgi:hypothetical protein